MEVSTITVVCLGTSLDSVGQDLLMKAMSTLQALSRKKESYPQQGNGNCLQYTNHQSENIHHTGTNPPRNILNGRTYAGARQPQHSFRAHTSQGPEDQSDGNFGSQHNVCMAVRRFRGNITPIREENSTFDYVDSGGTHNFFHSKSSFQYYEAIMSG